MSGATIADRVIVFLQPMVGRTVHRDQMREHLNLSDSQISNVMGGLKKDVKGVLPFSVEVVLGGRLWNIKPKVERQEKEDLPASTPEIYQEIGKTSWGQILVEDTAGNIFRLQEV